MHAKEIELFSKNELVRRKHQEGLSYSKISHQLKLSKSTVHDMMKNEYEKPKKAKGTKGKTSGFEPLKFRGSNAAL